MLICPPLHFKNKQNPCTQLKWSHYHTENYYLKVSQREVFDNHTLEESLLANKIWLFWFRTNAAANLAQYTSSSVVYMTRTLHSFSSNNGFYHFHPAQNYICVITFLGFFSSSSQNNWSASGGTAKVLFKIYIFNIS